MKATGLKGLIRIGYLGTHLRRKTSLRVGKADYLTFQGGQVSTWKGS